jgi:hypothetical protein
MATAGWPSSLACRLATRVRSARFSASVPTTVMRRPQGPTSASHCPARSSSPTRPSSADRIGGIHLQQAVERRRRASEVAALLGGARGLDQRRPALAAAGGAVCSSAASASSTTSRSPGRLGGVGDLRQAIDQLAGGVQPGRGIGAALAERPPVVADGRRGGRARSRRGCARPPATAPPCGPLSGRGLGGRVQRAQVDRGSPSLSASPRSRPAPRRPPAAAPAAPTGAPWPPAGCRRPPAARPISRCRDRARPGRRTQRALRGRRPARPCDRRRVAIAQQRQRLAAHLHRRAGRRRIFSARGRPASPPRSRPAAGAARPARPA